MGRGDTRTWWQVALLALAAAAILVLAVLAGLRFPNGGDRDMDAAGATSGSSPSTAPTPASTTTTTAVPLCGAVTAEMVSGALGETATFLGTDESGCGFVAGSWRFGVRALALDPATQGALRTTPTLPGVSAPHSAMLTNDRSGNWNVRATIVAGDVVYDIWLLNGARGADTYPDVTGPEQRPRTEAAGVALLDAIARAA